MDPAGLVGQSFAGPAYVVTRGKIGEFATAVGETSALCHDPEAARAAGYPDVVAPPTFAVIPAFTGLAAAMARFDVPLERQLHGEQSFTHVRPIVAGDVLTTTATIDRVRGGAARMFVTVSCELRDEAGDAVTHARSTIAISGEAS